MRHPYALINWNDHKNNDKHKARRDDCKVYEQRIKEGKNN